MPRKVTPGEGEFYIVGGKQGIHSHTMTQNIAALNAISREYHMERLWMAAQDAEKLGVETGDLVEVSSSEHTGQVEVRVTQRLKPGRRVPSHPLRRGLAVSDALLSVRHQSDRLHPVRR